MVLQHKPSPTGYMHSLPGLSYLSQLLRSKTLPTNQIQQIHVQLISSSVKSTTVFTKLIEHYTASPQPTNFARLVVTRFDPPTVYLLNVLIKCSLPRQSILIFANWVSKASLVFDDFTYIFALGACARCSAIDLALWEGKQIHFRVLKVGLMENVMLQTTAIHFYGNSHDVLSARKVFDEMPVRNSVTWTSLIAGYCSQRERVGDALILFKEMLVEGREPSERTMVCVLSAASELGFLKTGICIHGYIEKTIADPEYDAYIGTCLVDMYAKCGCLDFALYIFMRMTDRNVLTWTAMMTGLALHGRGKQVLKLMDAMDAYGIRPNEVTFTSILLACGHAGLVEEGLCMFHRMESKFKMPPRMQHYGCVVDLLGRAGHINEAYEFITSRGFEHEVVLWKSLLHACSVQGDVVMGEKVAKILITLQPKKKFVGSAYRSEDFIALSNICASAQKWEDVAMVREVMNVKRMETKPASSVLA